MLELYLFGSLTCGDVDPGSDIDVLAVVDDSAEQSRFPADWSVYSESKVRELHARGTLFAWHLFLDAVQVYPRTGPGVIGSLGEPTPYTQAADEIAGLLRVGERATREIAEGSPSLVFELGLIYLVARDVAMAGSHCVLGRFTFSRYAPFEYDEDPFPLSRAEYTYIMSCRRASTRGILFPRRDCVETCVARQARDVLDWCGRINHGVTQCTRS